MKKIKKHNVKVYFHLFTAYVMLELSPLTPLLGIKLSEESYAHLPYLVFRGVTGCRGVFDANSVTWYSGLTPSENLLYGPGKHISM